MRVDDFIALVAEMRLKQKEYFRRPDRRDLPGIRSIEAEVDGLIKLVQGEARYWPRGEQQQLFKET